MWLLLLGDVSSHSNKLMSVEKRKENGENLEKPPENVKDHGLPVDSSVKELLAHKAIQK